MKIHAYAAMSKGGKLVPFTYEVKELGPFEVLIQVSHCGLCYSDVHLIDNDWNRSKYPLVPGHEVVGKVVKKGGELEGVEIGERVGVSWVRSSCMCCDLCIAGDTNICLQKTTTCNGNYGGFGDHMVADGRFVYKIPEAMDSGEAAPLLCAGSTVFAPLRRHEVRGSVAVIGIGGLGHLGLQFAAAMGCEVTAISHSKNKEQEAKSFGAHHFAGLGDGGKYDFILSTVQADLDWNLVLGSLKPKGVLCFVGRPGSPGLFDVGQLISYQKNICGSSTANRTVMNEMLHFAAHHKIKPKIERMPLKEVNTAIQRVKDNAARFRIVLET